MKTHTETNEVKGLNNPIGNIMQQCTHSAAVLKAVEKSKFVDLAPCIRWQIVRSRSLPKHTPSGLTFCYHSMGGDRWSRSTKKKTVHSPKMRSLIPLSRCCRSLSALSDLSMASLRALAFFWSDRLLLNVLVRRGPRSTCALCCCERPSSRSPPLGRCESSMVYVFV